MTKATIKLAPGSLVSHDGEDWLVKEQDGFERILAARVRDGRREFLAIAELRPPSSTEEDGDGAKRNTKKPVLTEKARFDQDPALQRHQDMYRDLVGISKISAGARKHAIGDFRGKFGLSVATVYRKLKLVEQGADADALFRVERNDRRGLGSKAGPDRLKVVRERLRKHYFTREPRSVPDILEFINGDLRAQGLKEVSLRFVYRTRDEVTFQKRLLSQGRAKQARDAFRPRVGHLPDADYPLSTIQVDHTPCQICFVDEKTRQPIDDAWLTLVVDCYSRMVLGFYLTFGAPSTVSAGMALARAFLPKDVLLRRLDIKGEWPCWGFCDVVLVDNAAELNGKMMQSARNEYRFTIRDRPIGAPNFGGHVESAFKTFMYEIKSIAGTKFSNPKERAEYDSEGRALLTLREFEWYFTEFLVNDYHLAEHSGEGMDRRTPLQRWTAGIFDGDVFPPVGLPDLPANPEAVQISLMPVEWRTISNATVAIFNETYYSGALQTLSNDVDPTKPESARKFEIRYDPRDISRIWVRDPGTGNYIEARFTNLGKEPISLWEHNARKRALGNPSEAFKESRYQSKLLREAFKEKKAAETKQARRAAEKAKRDAEDSLVQPKQVKKTPKPAPAVPRRSPQEIYEAMRRKLDEEGSK